MKLSKTQRGVLERMAAGETLGVNKSMGVADLSDGTPVHIDDAQHLIVYELVEVDWSGDWYVRYTITDAGREAIGEINN